MNDVVAIIPARGGSKGIPRKNLVEIAGEPLIVHSINHALTAQRVSRVIVSTDDEEIADVARKAGAEVPFLRPKELAEDLVLDLPVFQHALKFLLDQENYQPELVVHLRPTAPLRKPDWIDAAIDQLRKVPEADSLRSVSKPNQHPYRVFRIDQAGYLDPIMKHEHPMPYLLRRQDLPDLYYYNCVIDLTRPSTIFGKASMTGDRILPFVMDPEDVVDIDTRMDLALARLMMEAVGT